MKRKLLEAIFQPEFLECDVTGFIALYFQLSVKISLVVCIIYIKKTCSIQKTG